MDPGRLLQGKARQESGSYQGLSTSDPTQARQRGSAQQTR